MPRRRAAPPKNRLNQTYAQLKTALSNSNKKSQLKQLKVAQSAWLGYVKQDQGFDVMVRGQDFASDLLSVI
jgi:uncharacterized protein YecT (DUF1311 family)